MNDLRTDVEKAAEVLNPPRHFHYCKDFRAADTCVDRGHCECVCGARARLSTFVWMMPAEWAAKMAVTT